MSSSSFESKMSASANHILLRWLEIVSSIYILNGRYNHSYPSKYNCWKTVSSHLRRIKYCSCLRHILNILLTELNQSVWENLDLDHVYTPYCVRSVLTTSVKILPYRSPPRLKSEVVLTNRKIIEWISYGLRNRTLNMP